jgi:MFS family permease
VAGKIIGLTVAEAGLGLTIGLASQFLVSIPFGRLADRIGARTCWGAGNALQAAAFLGWLFVHGFWPFIAVVVGREVTGVALATGSLTVIRLIPILTAAILLVSAAMISRLPAAAQPAESHAPAEMRPAAESELPSEIQPDEAPPPPRPRPAFRRDARPSGTPAS